METPIADFVRNYQKSDSIRLHMPGHKGRAFLGCEPWDITEIQGADDLYEAEGIIAQSEANAAQLFGAGRTIYSTEGSSQCIRAMLYLALQNRPAGTTPVIVAARNVHKTFVFAAALLDFETVWLWPEEESASLCSCTVTQEGLSKVLDDLASPPAAVYVTSPDYLGNEADIAGLAEVCHRYGTILLVDNAHGAYLRFLKPSRHPMDLGADLCCDSAHKTLPALTGSAYLHISRTAPEGISSGARSAMALFGSTSPSYLTLASLDLTNRYLSEDYGTVLAETIRQLARAKTQLRENGWTILDTDPLKLTIAAASSGHRGTALADRLRSQDMECEFADPDYLVCMVTPSNEASCLRRLVAALGSNGASPVQSAALPIVAGERCLSVREAMFAKHETVSVRQSLGRICGAPAVTCPPAIPIAVSGERIDENAVTLFEHYGIHQVCVIK